MKNDSITEMLTTFRAHVSAVARNTHAGVAMVGASIIDENLRAAILTRMRKLSKGMESRLFEGYAPLGTLASRIDMAFALDIISAELREEIDKIRGIRNAFAHSKKLLNFNDPLIAEKCRTLRTWDASKTDFQDVYMESIRVIDAALEKVLAASQKRSGPEEPPLS